MYVDKIKIENAYKGYPISGCFCKVGVGTREYVVPLTSETYLPYSYTPQDGMKAMGLYPGHEGYYYDINQKTDIFGNTVPIVMYKSDYYDSSKQLMFEVKPYGRFGDQMNNYLLDMVFKGSANGGEPVQGGIDDLATFASQAIGSNTYDLEFDIPCTVDEIQGYNKTNIHLDVTTGDGMAPSIRMMQMRDADGNVTDRFENAADGHMMFTAVDFVKVPNTIFSTAIKPAAVSVACAPHTTTDWSRLEFNEAQQYHYYNYGFTYTADLGQVTTASNSGWYDIKIRIEDEAGNSNEQVISPAFYVNAYSAINDIVVDCKHISDVYDLQGRRIGNSIEGVVKGIYIIRNNDGSTQKALIK